MLSFFAHNRLKRSTVRRWLLPSLIARILIPIGFMPGNLWAGEYMVPCPSAMPETIFAATEHHGHHEHHANDDGGDLLGAERQCPIGLVLSAVFIAAPEPHALSANYLPTTFVERVTSAPAVVTPRRYRTRAPPLAAI